MSSAEVQTADRPTKSERTRLRIVEAAASLLAEHGYAGTRMADIGERAGLRDASLYYHFSSKDELVQEILRRGIQRTHRHVREQLAGLPATATHREKLATALRGHLETVVELDDLGRAPIRIMSQVPAELAGEFRGLQSAYGALWNRLLREAADDGAINVRGDLAATRLFIIGALNWVVDWPKSALRPASELGLVAESLILDGLCGHTPVDDDHES